MPFLSHIDPGNSGGSVLIPESMFEEIPVKTVEYRCPYCSESFVSQELMRSHRTESHPLRRPYLLINGKPCRQEETIHRHIEAGSLSFEDALSVSLDGVPCESTQLLEQKLLAKQTGRRKIELSYQTYSTTVDLIFDIISHDDLVAVEECFYTTFDSDELSASHLTRFYNKIKAKGLNGNSYAGGLGCYLSGVLAKDRSPDIGIPFEDFPNKFGEAEDKLANIDRPLAQTIIFALQFNRNCFASPGLLVNAPVLQSAAKFMRSGQFSDVPLAPVEVWSKIPTDTVTEQLLAFCTNGAIYRNRTRSELEQLLKHDRIEKRDRSKLAFLLMVSCLESNDFQGAQRLFRTIKYDPELGETATKVMDFER